MPGPPLNHQPALPRFVHTVADGEHGVTPPELSFRLDDHAPQGITLPTGHRLVPGDSHKITSDDWASMTPEEITDVHRLITDPRRQTALLGGHYVREVPDATGDPR